MTHAVVRTHLSRVVLSLAFALTAPHAQVASTDFECTKDFSSLGRMRDVTSNALSRGLDRDSEEVQRVLNKAMETATSLDELLGAAAAHYDMPVETLAGTVERYKHCNCTHSLDANGRPVAPEGDGEMSQFARDVITHVVLHEIGHGLIREFDLPILANEETMADAFATHYLTAHMPDRARDVIEARTRSLMIEAGEVARDEWPVNGEHNSDARRAFQIAGLAVAADPAKYEDIARGLGMADRDIAKASDYGTEIHRSWRRILQPLWMPAGMESGEARLTRDKNDAFLERLCANGLADELRAALKRFDWHSGVRVHFTDEGSGANWSRSKRTIAVNREYAHRFVGQGRIVKPSVK